MAVQHDSVTVIFRNAGRQSVSGPASKGIPPRGCRKVKDNYSMYETILCLILC